MIGRSPPLDTIAFVSMLAGRYFKAHPWMVEAPDHGAPIKIDPRCGNPWSTGRLAQRHNAFDKSPIAMSYFATTPIAALFEALFRNAKILPGRGVYFERAKLAGWCLSELTLTRAIDVIPAGLPDRGMVVTNPANEEHWCYLTSTGNHPATWRAALDVAAQLRTAGHNFGGITWNSVRFPAHGTVYLLYDPPNGPDLWITESTIRLDTVRGVAAIARALREFGYTWIDSRLVDYFAPPPDAQ